jgi:hypothetical protein
MQSITIKEDTTNSVIVSGWSRNVNNPGDAIRTDVALPMASEERAGIMPAESFSQIEENTTRIESLEGRALHYSVTLASDTPTQGALQTAYETASGETGTAPDQVTLDDTAYNKSYTWYETREEWVDRGTSTISQFTNSSLGTIKGSSVPGKIFAENDGTGSVVDWDVTQAAVANLQSSKADKTTATTSEAGLMSSSDKSKLNGIAITNITADWKNHLQSTYVNWGSPNANAGINSVLKYGKLVIVNFGGESTANLQDIPAGVVFATLTKYRPIMGALFILNFTGQLASSLSLTTTGQFAQWNMNTIAAGTAYFNGQMCYFTDE